MGLDRRKWVGAKIETTKGTPQALVAADAAILAYDPVIDQAINFAQRNPAGLAMGNLKSVQNEHMGKASLRVEARSGGTVPKWASTLLIASGMVDATGTLSLVSSLSAQKTVTFGVWEDGQFKSLAGAMCNCTIDGEVGKRVFFKFDLTGIWITPVDAVVPTVTHEAALPLRLASSTFTLAGASKKISKFSLDFGNDIQMRPDHNVASALAHAYLADRSPKCTFDPESDLVANDDLYGKWLAGTEEALSLILGSTGNKITLAAPRVQNIDPKEGNRNKLSIDQVSAQLNADAGDDEFTIVFA